MGKTKQTQTQDAAEGHALALLFLVTFGLLSLLLVGLLYGQVAQVVTRAGRCTVLSSQITATDINDVGGETDGTVYYLGFQVLLQMADGQHVRVAGYYGSLDYNFGDKASAQNAQRQYAVGSTQNCDYTYLATSSVKALFAPVAPMEGIVFISVLLLISLVLTGICIYYIRKPPTSLKVDNAEVSEDDIDFGADALVADAQQV